MQFLSDVYLRCPECDGRRYRSEVLDVKIRPPRGIGAGAGGRIGERTAARTRGAVMGSGAEPDIGTNDRGTLRPKPSGGDAGEPPELAAAPRSMADILDLTAEDALSFFDGCPDVTRPLAPLAAVGLDYLRLGQPVPDPLGRARRSG